jgi:hypothetical protein
MGDLHAEGQATAMRQPVDLSRVDATKTRGQAEERGAVFGTLVDKSVGFGRLNVKPFAKLCGAATEMVHNGSAQYGLRLNGLCHLASIGYGHVRENFTPAFQDAAALMVRGTVTDLESPALYDIVFEQLADVRGAHSLGVMNGGVRHLGIASVTRNTCCPDRLMVLVTGTAHDRYSLDPDTTEIERYRLDLGWNELPSSVPEHLRLLLVRHAATWDLARRSGRRLADLGFKRASELASGFPEILVVPALTTGPRLPDRDTGTPYAPGLDPSMLELASEQDRPVMLCLGSLDIDRDELERRYPRVPVDTLEWSEHFGLFSPMYGVEYRGNRDVLIRCEYQRTPDGSVGLLATGWRLVGVGPSHRDRVIAICEHLARETWPEECLDQFLIRTEPGLLQTREPRNRSGMHASGVVGNATNVVADRQSRK